MKLSIEKMAPILAMALVLTGCSTLVADRQIWSLKMGPAVDGLRTKMINGHDQVLQVSAALDPIMNEVGFELEGRSKGYELSPHPGPSCVASYKLTNGVYSRVVWCLTRVDTKSIEVSFSVLETDIGKKDFPPSTEVRALTTRPTQQIKEILSSRFPTRAIQICDVYWADNWPPAGR